MLSRSSRVRRRMSPTYHGEALAAKRPSVALAICVNFFSQGCKCCALFSIILLSHLAPAPLWNPINFEMRGCDKCWGKRPVNEPVLRKDLGNESQWLFPIAPHGETFATYHVICGFSGRHHLSAQCCSGTETDTVAYLGIMPLQRSICVAI